MAISQGLNKAYLLSLRGTGYTHKHIPFQRKTGFNSEHDLVLSLCYIMDSDSNFDITTYVLNIGAYAKNLGNTYIDYIMLNIQDYVTLLSLTLPNENALTHELIYSKTLSKLVTINLYKKHLGEDYSLPPALSRKFINIEMALSDYLNSKADTTNIDGFINNVNLCQEIKMPVR